MNYLYGILTDGVVTENTPGYRHTDCIRTNDVHKLLHKVMGKNKEEIAAKADLFIKLMRSVPSWVYFIKEYDKDNTYEEPVYPKLNAIPKNFYEDLKVWVDNLNINCTTYRVSPNDDFLQRLINSLYTIVTTK